MEWSPLGLGSGAGQCMDTERVQPDSALRTPLQPDSAHLTPLQPDSAHLTPLQPTPHLLPGELRLQTFFIYILLYAIISIAVVLHSDLYFCAGKAHSLLNIPRLSRRAH